MSCCGGGDDVGQNACDLKTQCAFAKCASCPEQMVKCRASGCGGRVHPLCWKKLYNKEFAAKSDSLQATIPLCSTKCAKTFGMPEGPK